MEDWDKNYKKYFTKLGEMSTTLRALPDLVFAFSFSLYVPFLWYLLYSHQILTAKHITQEVM